MERLIKEVLSLSEENQKKIIEAIRQEGHRRHEEEAIKRGEIYARTASEVLGIDVTDKCKGWAYKWGRTMVVWQMFLDGFTQRETGIVLGIDHTSACDMKQKFTHISSSPDLFPLECEAWRKFKKRIAR